MCGLTGRARVSRNAPLDMYLATAVNFSQVSALCLLYDAVVVVWCTYLYPSRIDLLWCWHNIWLLAHFLSPTQIWALYCLLLMYHKFHVELAPIRPVSKFIVVKVGQNGTGSKAKYAITNECLCCNLMGLFGCSICTDTALDQTLIALQALCVGIGTDRCIFPCISYSYLIFWDHIWYK